jgi:hypothetical protein
MLRLTEGRDQIKAAWQVLSRRNISISCCPPAPCTSKLECQWVAARVTELLTRNEVPRVAGHSCFGQVNFGEPIPPSWEH